MQMHYARSFLTVLLLVGSLGVVKQAIAAEDTSPPARNSCGGKPIVVKASISWVTFMVPIWGRKRSSGAVCHDDSRHHGDELSFGQMIRNGVQERMPVRLTA
jgi:hypothetical protein